MSLTRYLLYLWRPQSSGDIERQHGTKKNGLFMLCEDRNCEWTDILKSDISSTNATINSATDVSPHCVSTGRQSNIGLPKLPYNELTNQSHTAYGMQMNALFKQVYQRVALANNEAVHKLNAKQNQLLYKDPIQVGNKVLLHCPQSTDAHSLHLDWIRPFEVVKTNDMVIQVRNEKGETD